MRTALASLIATAALVSAAQAQTPAAPSAPQTATPAPPATSTPSTTTPPTTTPSTTTPPATTAPTAGATPPATTATPAPGAAEPAAPAAPAAEAPPTLPTTGPGAVLLNIIEKVCVPLVRGGSLDQLAPQIQGMRRNRRDSTWSMPLGGASRDYTVTLFPVGANKDVCRGEVHYAFDDDKTIVTAFNTWAFLHQPELILQANYVEVDPDGIKRVRKSWEHLDSTSSTAINFTTMTKPDDTPLNKNYATGEIYYQERKF